MLRFPAFCSPKLIQRNLVFCRIIRGWLFSSNATFSHSVPQANLKKTRVLLRNSCSYICIKSCIFHHPQIQRKLALARFKTIFSNYSNLVWLHHLILYSSCVYLVHYPCFAINLVGFDDANCHLYLFTAFSMSLVDIALHEEFVFEVLIFSTFIVYRSRTVRLNMNIDDKYWNIHSTNFLSLIPHNYNTNVKSNYI